MSESEDIYDEKWIANQLDQLQLPPNHLDLRHRADRCIAQGDNSEAILSLTNSHMPILRMKTLIIKEHDAKLGVSSFKSMESITKSLEEMPKEWTIIQLTPQFEGKEYLNLSKEKCCTPGLHITVFNCGPNQSKPFLQTISPPTHAMIEGNLNIIGNITKALAEIKSVLSGIAINAVKNKTYRHMYHLKRDEFDRSIESAVNDVEYSWLKEWRCLFMGKYENQELEVQIKNQIKDFLGEINDIENTSEELEILLYYLIKSFDYLKVKDLHSAFQSRLPKIYENKPLLKMLLKFVKDVDKNLGLRSAKTHPIILLVDDDLDMIPFEMISVMQGRTVTRLPDLIFVKLLFKRHQNYIKDGYRIIKANHISYLINPEANLDRMQIRMTHFFDYWLPNSLGIIGRAPEHKEILEILCSSDVFLYSGHGNGAHVLPVKEIEVSNIDAVILLFGCGSVTNLRMGHHIESFALYHMYLKALCPCVVGMLWEITDLEMDRLTTDFLSNWIPSEAPYHWKNVVKDRWMDADKSFKAKSKKGEGDVIPNKASISQAMWAAKRGEFRYNMKASCIIRGIPVKIA